MAQLLLFSVQCLKGDTVKTPLNVLITILKEEGVLTEEAAQDIYSIYSLVSTLEKITTGLLTDREKAYINIVDQIVATGNYEAALVIDPPPRLREFRKLIERVYNRSLDHATTN